MKEVEVKDIQPATSPPNVPKPIFVKIDEYEERFEDDDGGMDRKSEATEYAETLPGYREYLREHNELTG